jgi:ABC-type nitrate/sulfonate/bicarbonate transport system substrate-binding protein
MMVDRRAALATLGALALTPAQVAAQTAPFPIHAGHPPTETAAPALYAIRAGLFDRAGIALTIDKMSSGAAVAAAVAGGGLDLGGTSILAIIIGHTHGIPFTLISAANVMMYPEADGGLLVQANSPLTRPKDFIGKTISAAALNDIVSLELWTWMDRGGVDWHSLKIVEIPQPAALAALDAGRIDGIVLTGSAYAEAVANPKVRLLSRVASNLAPRFANTCWFSTRDWVTKNHAVAARFARVMSDASAYVNAHPDDTLKDVLDYTGMDRAAALKMKRAVFSTTLSPNDVQPVIAAAAKFKMIDKEYPAAELFSDVVPRA